MEFTFDYFRSAGIMAETVQTLVVPPQYTAIGPGALQGLVNLQTIDLNNVSRLGKEALAGTGLRVLRLGPQVTRVDTLAVAGCVSLHTVRIDGNPVLGEACFARSGIQVFEAPALTTLPRFALSQTALQHWSLPPNLHTIGYKALSHIGTLETLTSLPLCALETIEDGAFIGCHSLRFVHVAGPVAWIGSGVFDGCHQLERIGLSKGAHLHTLGDTYVYRDADTAPPSWSVVRELAAMVPHCQFIRVGNLQHTAAAH